MEITVLIGKTLAAVEKNGDEELIFRTDAGEAYRMWHDQNCCESVYIEDIVGNLDDLIGAPLLMADESSNSQDPHRKEEDDDSYTWTFYRFATIKGSVTIRWYGTSNGYYSEDVDFVKIDG